MVVGTGIYILVHMLCKVVYAVYAHNAFKVAVDVLDVLVLVAALIFHIAGQIECAGQRTRHGIHIDAVPKIRLPLIERLGKAFSHFKVHIGNRQTSCLFSAAVDDNITKHFTLVGVFGYFHHLVLFGVGLLAAAFRGRAALLL